MDAQHPHGLKGETAPDCAAEIHSITKCGKTPPCVIEKVSGIKMGGRVLGRNYHKCLCCSCSSLDACLGAQLEHVCGGGGSVCKLFATRR